MSNSWSNLVKIIWVFSAKAGKGVGGLLLTYVLARKYGAYGSGLFFIAYTFSFLCAQFSQLGLGNSCLKFAPVLQKEDPNNLSFLWTVTQLIVGAFSILLLLVVGTAPEFFSELVFKNPGNSEYIFGAAPIILFWSLTYLIVFFGRVWGMLLGLRLLKTQ